MEHTTHSSLEAVHAAIQGQNIFAQAGIVRKQNVWDIKFPDVSSFNAHASDTVLQALEKVKNNESDKVTSIVVTAQQGEGKTHLLKRVCYQGKQRGETSFIYANVMTYTDLDLINYQFQQSVVDSFANLGSQEVTQWQEIATAMVNGIVKTPRTPKVLINQFDTAYQDNLKKGRNLVDVLLQKLGQIHKNTDPYILRAILWTLSEKYSSYAVKWLTGDGIEGSHAKFLSLPANTEKSNQDRESEALGTVQKILNIVGYYHSVIICFDEIETQRDKTNTAGLLTSQVIALLAKSLYDTLYQFKLGKGVVILTVTLPDTWRNVVNTMPGGIPERMSAYTQRKPVELEPIDANSMVELVKLWLNIFYTKKKLVPPHEIYPFDEQELREYAKQKPTVREAIRWCGNRFKVDEVLPQTPQERFELALQREKEEVDEEFLEDSELIAEILKFGFESLIGQEINTETPSGEKIEGLVIHEIAEVTPKNKNSGWINFKIIGTEQSQQFKIGIAVLQHSHGLSVGAGMTRLIDYSTFDFTRGCLVRSKDKAIKKNWDSYDYLTQLIEQSGGEWVDLKFEEIQPIKQLYNIYQKRENYQLSEEEFLEFSRQETIKNNLLLEVLSDPSGDIFPPPIEKLDPDPNTVSLIDDPFSTEEDQENIEDEKNNNSKEGNENTNPKIEPPVKEKGVEIDEQWFEINYTGKTILAFTFVSDRYEVNSWRDFLITVCTLINLRHKRDIEKLLTLKGRTRSYVSKNQDELNSSEKIAGTNLYIETSLGGANDIVKIVYKIITLFDYSDDCIAIELDE